VITALIDKSVSVVCVTHLYELARGFYATHQSETLFLRAERQADGKRSFKLLVGEPLQTSFGLDLYDRVFSREARPVEVVGSGE
jgi:hypothetical protein